MGLLVAPQSAIVTVGFGYEGRLPVRTTRRHMAVASGRKSRERASICFACSIRERGCRIELL